MRRAKGAPIGELAAGDLARHGVDHRDLEQLARAERRQDRGQARREHGLAGAGRAVHQQIMAPGGGDLERALGALLALHVAEIREIACLAPHSGLRSREHLRSAQMVGELDERARRARARATPRPPCRRDPRH